MERTFLDLRASHIPIEFSTCTTVFTLYIDETHNLTKILFLVTARVSHISILCSAAAIPGTGPWGTLPPPPTSDSINDVRYVRENGQKYS